MGFNIILFKFKFIWVVTNRDVVGTCSLQWYKLGFVCALLISSSCPCQLCWGRCPPPCVPELHRSVNCPAPSNPRLPLTSFQLLPALLFRSQRFRLSDSTFSSGKLFLGSYMLWFFLFLHWNWSEKELSVYWRIIS